jgi:hypothetical protein
MESAALEILRWGPEARINNQKIRAAGHGSKTWRVTSLGETLFPLDRDLRSKLTTSREVWVSKRGEVRRGQPSSIRLNHLHLPDTNAMYNTCRSLICGQATPNRIDQLANPVVSNWASAAEKD